MATSREARQSREWSDPSRAARDRHLCHEARRVKSLKSVLREGAIIVSLQNGIEGPDIIAAPPPGAHGVPGLARISSHIARPGAIEHKAQAGRIEFGEPDGRAPPRLEAFHRACQDAGIDAVLASDIRYNVWLKFASLAASSGVMTLTNASYGPVRETPGTRALLEDAVREAIAVGTATGVPFKPTDFASIMKAADSNPREMVSSMLVDRRAGKPLEINYFSGTLVRMGEKLGVPTPTHKFIAQALSIDANGRT